MTILSLHNQRLVPNIFGMLFRVFRESPDGRNTIVILSLPGVQKSDVHISYQHRRLIISYKSVEETERWEHDKVIQETKEKRCVRAIPLPDIIRVCAILDLQWIMSTEDLSPGY